MSRAWLEREWTNQEGKKRRTGLSKRSKTSDSTLKAEGWKVAGYYVGYREPGSSKKTYKRFSTFDAARDAKTSLNKQLQDGAYVPKLTRAETMDVYVGRMLESAHDLAPSTLAGYKSTYLLHIRPALGKKAIGDLTTQQLQGLMNRLVQSAGSGTVTAVDQLLRRVFNAAVREGVLLSSPMRAVKVPKRKRKEINPLPVDVVEELADAIEPRYRAAILLAAYAGLRGGEVGGLRLKDVDFTNGVITINQAVRTVWGKPEVSQPKTSAGRRRITLPTFLSEELWKHTQDFGSTDLIFTAVKGGLVSHMTLNKAVKRAAAKIGIPEDERPDFHYLRHTCAALMIQTGAHPKAIQARMGHQDIQTTFNVYGHLFESLDAQVADDLHKMRTLAQSLRRPELPAAEPDAKPAVAL
jgi:integrase